MKPSLRCVGKGYTTRWNRWLSQHMQRHVINEENSDDSRIDGEGVDEGAQGRARDDVVEVRAARLSE